MHFDDLVGLMLFIASLFIILDSIIWLGAKLISGC